MQNTDEFIHEIVRHLTNSLLIADWIYDKHKNEFSSELKDEFLLLIGELEKMSEVIKSA